MPKTPVGAAKRGDDRVLRARPRRGTRRARATAGLAAGALPPRGPRRPRALVRGVSPSAIGSMSSLLERADRAAQRALACRVRDDDDLRELGREHRARSLEQLAHGRAELGALHRAHRAREELEVSLSAPQGRVGVERHDRARDRDDHDPERSARRAGRAGARTTARLALAKHVAGRGQGERSSARAVSGRPGDEAAIAGVTRRTPTPA